MVIVEVDMGAVGIVVLAPLADFLAWRGCGVVSLWELTTLDVNSELVSVLAIAIGDDVK